MISWVVWYSYVDLNVNLIYFIFFPTSLPCQFLSIRQLSISSLSDMAIWEWWWHMSSSACGRTWVCLFLLCPKNQSQSNQISVAFFFFFTFCSSIEYLVSFKSCKTRQHFSPPTKNSLLHCLLILFYLKQYIPMNLNAFFSNVTVAGFGCFDTSVIVFMYLQI